MARICCITGRRPVVGNKYAIRGIAKKKRGIGLKTTGIKRRRFLPNLKKKRLWDPETNSFVTLRLSMRGLRTVEKKGLSKSLEKN